MPHALVQAIIFDYGKVLSVPPTTGQWNRLAAVFGADQPSFQQQYWGLRDGYDRDEYDGAAYWHKIAEAFGKQLTDAQIKQLIAWDNEQWTSENHKMLELAFHQQETGRPIAILSNMQREMLTFMRKKFRWLEDFDVQVYSCEEGMVKPSKEIYLLTCERLGTSPQQTLFLDDKQHNVDGAKTAGLQAMLFAGDVKAVEKYLDGEM